MIKQVSLNHGWFYYYRMHKTRIENLPEKFNNLKTYLNQMLTNCPNEYFKSNFRSSRLKLIITPEFYELKGHELSQITQKAIEYNNNTHSNIQTFLLKHDPKTIAVEIPVWLTPEQLTIKENTKEILTGHIDILRYENNNIWIWDYKPSLKEKYIPTQLFFYALMLSKRTNLPLNNFTCGYFNKEKAFIFKPEEKFLWNLT